MKRVFLIVLDSLGIGFAPDAAEYGDLCAHTLKTVTEAGANIKNLASLGLYNIPAARLLQYAVKNPLASFGAMTEKSAGKDTVTGHWELCGIVSNKPMPTYPNGFPEQIVFDLEKLTGTKFLCNKPYSGTEVIKDYGDEHCRTGYPILYTSADSVLQIAAHKDVVPLTSLYQMCEKARALMCGENAVGRVIARPFEGASGAYKRTSERHDWALLPPQKTLLDNLCEKGLQTISVGKIIDIFASRGVTEYYRTSGNKEGQKKLLELAGRDFHGICFVNLVDFDMLYGHRNDKSGYAAALNDFDITLGKLLPLLSFDDMLIITADHGCDPGFKGTDHTRERVPLLVYQKGEKARDLGIYESFTAVSQIVGQMLN